MSTEELERSKADSPSRDLIDSKWSSLVAKGWPIGLLIFGFSLVLRCIGLDWGLPSETNHWSRHPDEPVVFAYSQQIKPAEGKFTPGFYNYGTFYLTALRVATDVVNAYGGGPVESKPDSAVSALANYHRAGRWINVLAGSGMAWIVFSVLRRRSNLFGAVIGGVAVGVAPGLVVHSRFQTVDVFATFLLTLGLAFAMRLSEDEHVRGKEPLKWALLSGAFIGLSAGTKYTGLLGLIALGAVCLSAQRWKELVLGLLMTAATFIIATPGCLLEPEKFWKDFGYEMAHTSTGHGLVFTGTGPGFVYHAVNLAIGFGAILSLLGVMGLVRAGYKRHVWALAIGLFGLAYFLLIGRAEVKFLRYTFPLMPVLAIGAGWFAGRAHENPNRRWRVVGFGAVLGLGGLLGGGAATTLQATAVMSTPDIRQTIVPLLKDGTVGLVSDPWFYTPDFYPEVNSPRWVPFAQRDAEMRAATIPKLERALPANPEERQDWDVHLLDLAPGTIVYSSFETEGLERLARYGNAPAQYKAQLDRYVAFQNRLKAEYDLVLTDQNNPWTVVHDLMYIRPTLWVWKRKASLKTPSSGSSTTSSTSEAPASTR